MIPLSCHARILFGLLPLLVVPVAAGGSDCGYTYREHHVSGWEDVEAVRLIRSIVTPHGTLKCRYYPDVDQRLNIRVPFETGALQGVEYKVFHTDGSAFIQGRRDAPLDIGDREHYWHLTCDASATDKADDVYCTLRKGDLALVRRPGEPLQVTLGDNHRDGSELLVRIDRNWAITAPAATGFSIEQSGKIVTQMRSGTSIDTRYQERARAYPSYRTLSLFGLGPALDIAETVFKQRLEAAGGRF